MALSPFALFRPFSDHLSVVLFTKDTPRPYPVVETLSARGLATARQVHGNRTVIAREPIEYAPDADGIVTDRSGLALSTRFADCQPFIVYAPDHGVLGVLHVGWRGLIAGAITQFFGTLKTEWGIHSSETYVGIGPSLCTKCATFSDPIHELPTVDRSFIVDHQVDLQGAADHELLRLGVLPSRIERHPQCTCCQHEKYWTYRGGDREAVKEGACNAIGCVLSGS
ncbi:MAG: polyphenol oxidase family protein [Candidatus Peregrinibacteria bacterium]